MQATTEFKNSHLTRQLDLIPVDTLTMPITIIGAGAIGSFAALQLAKMGYTRLTVWDFDNVSIENMSCQFYRYTDIGLPKVIALHDLIRAFTGASIRAINEPWTPDLTTTGVVVVAVDSMSVRLEIFDAIKKQCPDVSYILDPRMGAEDAALYVISPHDKADAVTYDKTLYSDANSVQERCTAKATIYTTNLLSGLVAKAIKNIACKQAYPRISLWSIANNDLKQWSRDYV